MEGIWVRSASWAEVRRSREKVVSVVEAKAEVRASMWTVEPETRSCLKRMVELGVESGDEK